MKPDELDRIMAALAAEYRSARAPLGVELEMLAEFDASRRRRAWGIAAVGAIAAMLVAGALVTWEWSERNAAVVKTAALNPPALRKVAQQERPTAKPVTKARSRKPPETSRQENALQETAGKPFVAIPYTVPLAPEEFAGVVRITLSPAAAAAVGFPLPAIDPGSDTQADVLVGEDGRARAIRIVANDSFR